MRIIVVCLSLILSACSIQAPEYQVSIDNVQTMKNADLQPIKVDKIATNKELNKISLRGSPMSSAVGTGYGDYLAKALEDELKLAKIWSGVSSTVISGELISNDIDVSGVSTGTGDLTVNFKVTRDNSVIFTKEVSAQIEFESSFIGAVAIPNGQKNYVTLIQKLINNLVTDDEFIAAVKS